ncbi:Uu.00g025870.m01.CDS01 [Anthostomella pinea]|uniref:Uu.00g025870.m01.CDS01 n=1 Tax=Anthostomella pinea TaxID=933095 RepID=A0AAI8V7A0_9PEZI|nr:Uu.00g025870.m01.CDS01 [Anthostomella pinea]
MERIRHTPAMLAREAGYEGEAGFGRWIIPLLRDELHDTPADDGDESRLKLAKQLVRADKAYMPSNSYPGLIKFANPDMNEILMEYTSQILIEFNELYPSYRPNKPDFQAADFYWVYQALAKARMDIEYRLVRPFMVVFHQHGRRRFGKQLNYSMFSEKELEDLVKDSYNAAEEICGRPDA